MWDDVILEILVDGFGLDLRVEGPGPAGDHNVTAAFFFFARVSDAPMRNKG